VGRGRLRTTPKAIAKWFVDLPPARIAMEAGTHSIWISEQLQELGHEVIVANVRELRRSLIATGRAITPMRRSSPASRAWIRRSCAPSRTAPSNSRKHSR
jgi:transposase